MRGRPPRIFKGKAHRPETPYVDRNLPGSPEYTERHRQTAFEIKPGMTRIDLGEPISAVGRTVFPVSDSAPAEPDGLPSVSVAASPVAAPSSPAVRDWRDDYGLGKGH